jgi:hypothetical protein
VAAKAFGTWYQYAGKGSNRHIVMEGGRRKRLSRDYQDRLQRNGITYDHYKKVGTVTAARGHAATPEKKIQPSDATEAQRAKYGKYIKSREGDVYILSTDGLKVYPRELIRPGDARKIGGHWEKIKRALNGDYVSQYIHIPSFRRTQVGGYNGIPRLQLEYRMDEVELAALTTAMGESDFEPFTIGSD